MMPTIILSRLMGKLGNIRKKLTEGDLDHLAKILDVEKSLIKEKHQKFLSYHPDGVISKKSFNSMFRSCFPSGDIKNMSKHVWRMFDTNQDGLIDFREFIKVLYVMNEGSSEDNLKQIFKLLDINSDGKIDFKELEQIVKDLRKLENKNKVCDFDANNLAEAAFKEMDKDQDGEITQQNFVTACLERRKFSTIIALRLIRIFIDT